MAEASVGALVAFFILIQCRSCYHLKYGDLQLTIQRILIEILFFVAPLLFGDERKLAYNDPNNVLTRALQIHGHWQVEKCYF